MSFRMSSVGRLAASKFVAAASPSGDPYFSNVSSLLHFEGADGSSTITDSSPTGGLTWAVVGAVRLDTDNFKFGTSSLKRNGGAGAQGIAATGEGVNQEFGTGDFTIEGWYNGLTSPQTGCILYMESSTASRPLYIYNNVVSYGVNGGSSLALAFVNNSTWQHWAVTRTGTTLSTFLSGNRVAQATYSGAVGGGASIAIGYYAPNSNLPFNGYIDEFRLTKGFARYTDATYTIPITAFPDA